MKYPITPEYLQKAPENLVSIYSALEENILLYLCEQFKTGKLNATAVEMIRTLQRRGIDLSEIEKRIKAAAKLSDAEFDHVISEAVGFNRQYYDATIDKLGLIGDTYRVDALALETQIIAEQTKGLFENITQSLGFAIRGADGKVQYLDIAKTYQHVLDVAEMQVQSGAFSYEEAIRGAVRTLSDSGVQWIDYSTGWNNRVDVAVRRAVMTGITQISAKYSDNLCEEVNTPYIEVTAHRGARDVPGKTPWASHKEWQGKVYSRNAGDIYPSVYAVCGLGEVDGLCGINCRHGYHAWIEGVSERTYTDEELANIDKPPFEFEGKTYSAYEATQKQRQIEASMRTVKRRMEASKAAGLEDDYTDYSIRYRRLDEEYRKFSEAAGLREQRDRTLVNRSEKFENSLYNRKKSSIIKSEKDALYQEGRSDDIPYDYDNDFSEFEQLGITEDERTQLLNLRKLSDDSNYEYGVCKLSDGWGEPYTSKLFDSVFTPKEYRNSVGATIFHSHTNNTAFSSDDIGVLVTNKFGRIGVIAANRDTYILRKQYDFSISVDEFDATAAEAAKFIDDGMLELAVANGWNAAQARYVANRMQTIMLAKEFDLVLEGGRI